MSKHRAGTATPPFVDGSRRSFFRFGRRHTAISALCHVQMHVAQKCARFWDDDMHRKRTLRHIF
ncbi:MAG: hypothetical protein E5V91_27985 [Mesorhizobium sp.]|nr:hypothetical protein EJ068_14255 [Mesorhizobium sp. M2A.F.Ca.ET.043.02.1.1]RUW41755.1 hypothetical protein EOA37_08665 [Mesorhizobium sp. M2A.F.Ca.ET.015.02.1.1]RUW74658.1 hypothetical protein EOA28_16670 [Mesorhizobium sp. M2A.F.Ca.ET.067.02.1.1]RVC91921.1 hypothetical protein EN739_27825 [Mesorhizobium sp. M2A.F.Ca.ET.017.03.2.1]RVD00875.1 hypothetical protein EN753_24275 [Mesorhizobium sp. M2A.F.Ca.ET.029.05.1.1]RWB39275.1 MAG: hypothetical protein EOQ46_27295 [Mesorhizobium sp.]